MTYQYRLISQDYIIGKKLSHYQLVSTPSAAISQFTNVFMKYMHINEP